MGGTGKAEAAKLQDAGISPKQWLKKMSGRKRVPYGNSKQVGSAINDTSKSKLSPVTSGTVVCRNR